MGRTSIYSALLLACAALFLFGGHGQGAAAPPLPDYGPSPELSVLTYNVHGLPWPVASGRSEALEAIGARLRSLRARGEQPHIVLLQEAFSSAAKRVAAESGYRYVALGPSERTRTPLPATATDRRFVADGSWLKGEGVGKFEDSGLMLLSDYPIVKLRGIAYPDYACAGFDCLANKGALLATLRLPGGRTIQVATTHLVSRFATEVSDDRSHYAYLREVDSLAAFLRASADPRVPIVLAGDFNVGIAPGRRAALLGAIERVWREAGYAAPADALRSCARQAPACTGTGTADASLSLRRARDWQFYAAAPRQILAVTGIRVLFGHEPGGSMLSDHVGYEADYTLGARSA